MNRKKMLPLVLLAAGAVLLGVLLAVLTCENEAEKDTGIPLVDFAAEDVDELAYSGNNVDVTLLKGSEGNWMLDSDPTPAAGAERRAEFGGEVHRPDRCPPTAGQ